MKILFLGGTGIISYDCSLQALAEGWEVYFLNRGLQERDLPAGIVTLKADLRNTKEVSNLLANKHFDVVADFICFTEEQALAALEVFCGKTGQYIFISSASVYHKPVLKIPITEATPAFNPFWIYSQQKIACEKIFIKAYQEEKFPVTIIRPSHTYSEIYFPFPFGGADFTLAARLLAQKEIFVHGDGESLWTLTHAADFAIGFMGLCGNPAAIGEIFHITSDEVLSWNNIVKIIASSLNVKPCLTHIPSEVIAQWDKDLGPGLLGDKMYSCIFDNTKLKRLVPNFSTKLPFHKGIRQTAKWFLTDKKRQIIDEKLDKKIEEFILKWRKFLNN